MRGKQVPYDKEIIHEYLEDTFAENSDEVDPFSKEVVKNNWDYNKIIVDSCIEFEIYEERRYTRPIQFKNLNLTTKV